jgi:hypothetical protein
MGGTAESAFVPWGQGFFVGRKTWGEGVCFKR